MFAKFIEGIRLARDGYTEPRGSNGESSPLATESMAEITAMAEALQARVDELEAEREAAPIEPLVMVLSLPGVKKWLASRFHPDKPDLAETERQWLTEKMQTINAAYEIVDRFK